MEAKCVAAIMCALTACSIIACAVVIVRLEIGTVEETSRRARPLSLLLCGLASYHTRPYPLEDPPDKEERT